MNGTARSVAAAVMAGAILAAFGVAYSSIIDRIDRLERQVVKVLDDHETRIRVIEHRIGTGP